MTPPPPPSSPSYLPRLTAAIPNTRVSFALDGFVYKLEIFLARWCTFHYQNINNEEIKVLDWKMIGNDNLTPLYGIC